MTAVHVLPVTIYYEDTDASGIVYHTSYLRFAERARTEMLRAAGLGQRALFAEAGLAFVVRHLACDFRKPARLDDCLEVRTRLGAVHCASIEMAHEIVRDGETLVELTLTLACITREGRATRMPKSLRSRLLTAHPSGAGEDAAQAV